MITIWGRTTSSNVQTVMWAIAVHESAKKMERHFPSFVAELKRYNGEKPGEQGDIEWIRPFKIVTM